MARWTFDEFAGGICADSSGHSHHARPDGGEPQSVRRIPGVLGNALLLRGSHRLRVADGMSFDGMSALTISAWVLPTDVSDYREILRKEDGDSRVLFSFQNSGTVLSLGLNVGGYVECDAQIDPAAVLDGAWHHCAGTFDGSTMRVYLDGKLVGTLKRPGTIAGGSGAPPFIGSTNGGEPLQGAIDELVIRSVALGDEQIRALYREGIESLEARRQAAPGDEPATGPGLVAQWRFNESGLAPVSPGGDGQPAAEPGKAFPRRAGVHGSAIDLSGAHSIPATIGPGLDGAEEITIACWTRPTDLSGFREIIRQECGHRILLSFQEGGTVLSLGLDVGGYLECDAPIDPRAVVDGAWHHCAGTFDGSTMGVYLDGREIGHAERPGRLALDLDPPAFIGSLGGESEHFQGLLDDLRVYRRALCAADVASLSDAGRASLARADEAAVTQLAGLYAAGPDLAVALTETQRRIAAAGGALDVDVAERLAARLTDAFPRECAILREGTLLSALDLLTPFGPEALRDGTRRLVDLALEYRPLTREQRSRQSPEQQAEWARAGTLEERLRALEKASDSGPVSPEWVRIALDAGANVHFRPSVQEAVAPYVPPSTPETRDLTAEEARAVLERDWLYQAGGVPSPERIKQEIDWARALASRIVRASGWNVDLSGPLAALDAAASEIAAASAPNRGVYFRVRRAKRDIVFRNPAVDFDSVLFADSPYPQGSEWQHETRHRLGYMAVPGGRLLVLRGLGPGGSLRQLAPQAPLHGSFWRPDLSFDGRTVLFCFKPHNEKSFHLYEVGTDGSGLRQLTDGPYDDLDPIYLPDGKHILFSTTRAHTYVRCMPPTNAFVLARCDRDGRGIYITSMNNEPDYLPSLLPDGRVVYTRWEYTDKPLWRAEKLWTVRPDGTQVNTLWGNQSVWPDLLKDARAIPGSNRVMFTGSAHHNWFSGAVGIIDPDAGRNFPDGLTKVTADVPWPECGNGPVDPVECSDYHTSGAYDAYYSPYPLGGEDFLVSASRGGKFALYLMDTHGNRELVYEGAHNILHAMPVRARPVPAVIPDSVAWPSGENRLHPEDGLFCSANVTEGMPDEVRDKVKYVRVLAIDPKTYTYWHERPYASTGPVVSLVQSDGVKRVLGTVPVEPDGSVAFRAPSGKALHFQLLDGRQRALQTMRSFTGVMPGEKRGCVGCHELHSVAPSQRTSFMAAARAPDTITPPPWGEDTVSYDRYVQPTLDRYCGACHEGSGEARKVLDLTRRPGYLMFDEPYVTLTGHPSWGAPYEAPKPAPPGWNLAGVLMVEGYSTTDPAAYVAPAPLTGLSYRSRLIDLVSRGAHYGVKVDPDSLLRLILWVDTVCPYYGEEEIRAIPDPDFQGVDWLAIRPRIATAPRIVRPGPVED